MATQEDYKVRLEVFEGPLDLLLYLIKKDELDIHNIPIETITTQYMSYLDVMRMLDLDIAGEFIVMAATLMLIKSRMLLPVEDRSELEEEEDDPRWDLVRQLLEYKKFKDAASRLQDMEMGQEDVFYLGRENLMLESEDAGVAIDDVSLFDLITAFNEVLKNRQKEDLGEIFAEPFTVAEKIEHVLATVSSKGRVVFLSLFDKMASRNEVICTFLAVLELIRLRQLAVTQSRQFGEIELSSVRENAPA